MNDTNKIQHAINLIESRLTEPINVDELAGQTYFSKTHFQRLFHSIVGEPVMEYVKKRRLEESANALRATNASVLEIALHYGYASHEGFTRAFKSYFGVPPLRYRKGNVKSDYRISKGEYTMKKINEHLQSIENELLNHSKQITAIAMQGEQAAKKENANIAGVLVLVSELNNFAGRINQSANDIKEMRAKDKSVFEIAEKVLQLMNILDDISFQMNLLRFFGGIEIARVQHIKALVDFEKKLDEIAAYICAERTAAGLLKELITLLQAVAKEDIVSYLQDSVTALRKTVQEGIDIRKTTDDKSHVFKRFGRETESRAAIASKTAEIFEALQADIKGTETGNVFIINHDIYHNAIKELEDFAFNMNINAFNAAIETARNGDSPDWVSYAERIRGYAWMVMQTAKTCETNLNECEKLFTLVCQNNRQAKEDTFTKAAYDLRFQGYILASQFNLEAYRAQHKGFIDLALRMEKELNALQPEIESLIEFNAALDKLILEMDAEIKKAGDIAPPFAYIALEYGYYATRIRALTSP